MKDEIGEGGGGENTGRDASATGEGACEVWVAVFHGRGSLVFFGGTE